jgi:glycolate oxidase
VADVVGLLGEVVGQAEVLTGSRISPDYGHDEALGTETILPLAVVRPSDTAEVAAVVRIASEHHIPVTARGSGTGLSGAAIPEAGGLLVSFERMNQILEVDTANHVAVVQPGVTLQQLNDALDPLRLVYPVFPGESSASLGGNVSTNAGGMRAVKYGVTRHHVLGLEIVLADGTVLRTGGKFVKSSTGYDLTQLIVGSEGTLALVTEVIVKLHHKPAHQVTVVAPFASLDEVTSAVPAIVASGIGPVILEYLDALTMGAITTSAGVDVAVPADVKERAAAYLVVVLENDHGNRLEEDTESLATGLADTGAIDVYVLPSNSGRRLIEARERAFFVAKASGADDIIDVVVPRAAVATYMSAVTGLASQYSAFVTGCGHVGDGNVHLSVFLPDRDQRQRFLHAVFAKSMELGGAISGEHGIGRAKKAHYLELEDPKKVDLLRKIKRVFDPERILAPGNTLFDESDLGGSR